MKNEITILKIRDTEDNKILDTFLVKNATQQALDGLQDLIESRYDEESENYEDWDYGLVYEYIENNFEIVGYEEETIDY